MSSYVLISFLAFLAATVSLRLINKRKNADDEKIVPRYIVLDRFCLLKNSKCEILIVNETFIYQ